jgi:hypothetical protein
MTKSLVCLSRCYASNFRTFTNNTFQIAAGNSSAVTSQSTETRVAFPVDFAGTFSGLGINVDGSGASGQTLTSRKNTAAGNQSVGFGGVSGIFSDTTHSDAVVQADLFNCGESVSTTGDKYSAFFGVFNKTSGVGAFHLCSQPFAGLNLGATTSYGIAGQGGSFSGAEAQLQALVRVAGTISRLAVYAVAGSDLSDTVTIRVRKNAANGNGVVSFATSASGLFTDTTHTDSVVSGDLVNTQAVVTNAGSGSANTLYFIGWSFAAASGSVVDIFGLSENISPPNFAAYMSVGGSADNFVSGFNSEGAQQVLAGFTSNYTNLRFHLQTSATSTTTVQFRKNAANGSQIATAGSGTTGWFEDTTNTDSCIATDKINLTISNSTGDGVLGAWAITGGEPSAAAPVSPDEPWIAHELFQGDDRARWWGQPLPRWSWNAPRPLLNTVPLLSRGLFMMAGRGGAAGTVPINAQALAAARGRGAASGTVPVLARGAAGLSGRTAATASAVLAAKGLAALEGRAPAVGTLPISAKGLAAARGRGGASGALPLAAKASAALEARGAAAGSAVLQAKGSAALQGKNAATGATSITARALAALRGRTTGTAAIFLTASASAALRGRTSAAGSLAVAAKGLAALRGAVPASGSVSLAAKGLAAARGNPAATFTANLVARVSASLQARAAAPTGTLSLAARGFVRFIGGLNTGVSLLARSLVMLRGRLSPPTGTLPLLARGAVATPTQARSTPTVSLSARTTVQLKAQAGPLQRLIALAASSLAMLRGRGAATYSAALQASTLAAATGKQAVSGAAALSARGAAGLRGSAMLRNMIFLQARALVALRGVATPPPTLIQLFARGMVALRGRATPLSAGTIFMGARSLLAFFGRFLYPVAPVPGICIPGDAPLFLNFSGDVATWTAAALASLSEGAEGVLMGTYDIDTTIQLTGTFANALTGQLADPTTITLYVQPPEGPPQQYVYGSSAIVRTAQGTYAFILTPSESGIWTYKWQGTGAVSVTSPDTTFTVRQSQLISG